MYYCYDCGYRFPEPLYLTGGEYHGEYWEPYTRRICPNCGSDDFETEEPDGDEE